MWVGGADQVPLVNVDAFPPLSTATQKGVNPPATQEVAVSESVETDVPLDQRGTEDCG